MTHNPKKLLAILAHPDDESLGMGGTLAKYAAEGAETYLITATRGERGRFGTAVESPGLEVVGRVRERELHLAADVLGVREVIFLDYLDKDLDQADPAEIVPRIAAHIRRTRPQVVLTFGPDGGYGHPDHIAISQFTGAAIVAAADPELRLDGDQPPFTVSKLYYMAWPPGKWEAYQSAFKQLVSHVDGQERRATPFPDWAITTRVDATTYWQTAWEAIRCHETQMEIYKNLDKLTTEQHLALWGRQEFYRVFSRVNGGRRVETDLFEGLE